MILETLQSHVLIKELHNRLADPFANPMIHLETKGSLGKDGLQTH